MLYRRLLWWVLLAAAIAGCASASGAVPRTHPSNKRAAERDARRLLARAILPPGSVRLAREPAGDGGLLRNAPEGSTGLMVDVHAWWRAKQSFASVVAFLKSHPEAGSKLTNWGHSGGPGVPANRILGFSFPPVKGVISSRELLFWVVALRGGATGIRADAQDVWIKPRPTSEKVPAGVTEIVVRSAFAGKPPIVSRRVRTPAKVRTIVAWIDRMPIVQPGLFMSCPSWRGQPPTVTFDFRGAGGLLAQASVTDGYSSACNPVSFEIRGRAQKPLDGGDFVSRVQRLLGVRFR